MAYDPAPWHDFYVVSGGAAAALAGLLFVAMSLHAREIMANPFYSNRAIGTLMSLASQLLISGAVLIPGQSVVALGAEVEVAALFFLAFIARQVVLRGRHPAPPVASTWTHRLMELGGGTVWILLFNAAGISLLLHGGGGFYLLAAVMFFMFAWNIYIAWILITEVSETG